MFADKIRSRGSKSSVTLQGIGLIVALSLAGPVALQTPLGKSSLTPTNLPLPRFAIIDLGTNQSPVFLNNQGTVVLVGSSKFTLWKSGITNAIPLTSVGGLNDSDVVAGGTGTAEWAPTNTDRETLHYINHPYTWTTNGLVKGPDFDSVFPTRPEMFPGQTAQYDYAYGAFFVGSVAGIDNSGNVYNNYLRQYSFIPSNAAPNYIVPSNAEDAVAAKGNSPIAATYGCFGTPDGSSYTTNALLYRIRAFPCGVVIGQSSTNHYFSSMQEYPINPIGPNAYYDGTNVHVTSSGNILSSVNSSGQILGYTTNLVVATYNMGTNTTTVPIAGVWNAAHQVVGGTPFVSTTFPYSSSSPGYIYPTNKLYDPSATSFTTSYLTNLITTNSGWTNVSGTAINDSGAIVGTATYSGTNTAIASGSHGIMLCPCAVVGYSSLTTYTVDMTNPVQNYVRFGLLDHAFDTATPANVLNGNAESANFVGSDSRRFYVRIYDPSATTATVTADWYTKKSDGTDEDHPTTDTITLTRSSSNPAVYASKALMLVADDVDNAQATDTGLTVDGTAAMGAADHRLRRAALGDTMCYAYTPAATGSTKQTFTEPIFNPSDLQQITVHAFNYMGGLHHAAKVDDAVITSGLQQIQARYAVTGIKVNAIYNSSHDVINVPDSTGIDLDNLPGFYIPTGSSALTPSTEQAALIDYIRNATTGLDPPSSANAKVVYVLFVGSIPGARGQSFPAAFSVPSNASNIVFVSGRDSLILTTPPHEMGHLLLNRVAGDIPSSNHGGHYVGIQADQNLMVNGTTDSTPQAVTDSKRLWDDPSHNDGVHDYQIDYLKQSPLLQPY